MTNLSFDILYQMKWFTVNFDSDSTERNRVIDIIYDGYKLDVVDLINSNPLLYADIKIKMAIVAKKHWAETNIPTLAYQVKKYIRPIFLYSLFMIPSFLFAQAHVDFGGGIVKSQDVFPVMKISVGYQFNNVVTEALMQPAVTRKVNAPRYFGLKAGYNFHNIITSVGYLYNYKSADDKRMNGWDIGYALEYQIQVNDNGGVYIEGMYVGGNYELTAGFHVIF